MTAAQLAVLVPMLGATLLAGASAFTERRAGIAVLTAVAVLALCILLLRDVHARGVVVWFAGWHPRDGAAVGIAFAVDRLGGALALFVAALGVVALVQAAVVIRTAALLFDAIALVFLAAMLGFALTGDLFNLFVFFELMSVSAYVLVGYQSHQRSPLEGSLTFAITNTVGSILLLFGIALLYGRTGALNLAQIGRELGGAPVDGTLVAAFTGIGAGLLIKAAVVPFHLWTADAYAVAPTPVCTLLAGAFSELGLYGFARVYWTAFEPAFGPHADGLRVVLVVLGAATALFGAVLCGLQEHLKRLLAFATISQVGLFLIGVGLLSSDGLAGASVWIVADGLVKAALFSCVAVVQHRSDQLDQATLHGRGREIWPVGLLVAFAALLIASLPATGSFLGRAMVEDAALKAGYGWVPAVMLVAGALVAGTLLRVAARVFGGWGSRPEVQPGQGAGDEPSGEAGRTPQVLWLSAAVLLAASVAWGLIPGVREAASHAASAFVGMPRPVAPPPSGASYMYATATLVLAVAWGAAGIAGAGARLPHPLAAVAARLHAVHSGRPGDYVAWAAAGTAALAVAFTAVLT